MRPVLILLVTMVFLINAACNKKNKIQNDLNGTATLSGRLYYKDVLHPGSAILALPGKAVAIAHSPSDGLNFIYSVQTDSGGYFTFTGLSKDSSYDIFFRDSVQGHLAAALLGPLHPPQDEIELDATIDYASQNVLSISVTDPNGSPVNGATVCLFNNLTLAQADTCNGSVSLPPTDLNGNTLIYNLAPGTYYTHTRFAGPHIYLYSSDQIVTTPGLTPMSVHLSVPPATGNKVTLSVVTADNQPVPYCQVCVFNNETLFLGKDCSGAILHPNVDSSGTFVLKNLAGGTYYFIASGTFGNLKLTGTNDGQVIDASGDQTVRIEVH